MEYGKNNKEMGGQRSKAHSIRGREGRGGGGGVNSLREEKKKVDEEEKENRYGLHALCGATICTVRVRKGKKDCGA